jgi:hypothetical protein
MSLIEVAEATAGICFLLVARVHRVKARQLRRQVLRRALASEDPANRRAAIQVAGDEGLASSVDLLLGLLKRETDRSVLLALAQVVVRNQWEPAKAPNMMNLRLWAHRYLEEQSTPSWRPAKSGPPASHFQGPSIGEVVNLLLQPQGRPTAHRALRARPAARGVPVDDRYE